MCAHACWCRLRAVTAPVCVTALPHSEQPMLAWHASHLEPGEVCSCGAKGMHSLIVRVSCFMRGMKGHPVVALGTCLMHVHLSSTGAQLCRLCTRKHGCNQGEDESGTGISELRGLVVPAASTSVLQPLPALAQVRRLVVGFMQTGESGFCAGPVCNLVRVASCSLMTTRALPHTCWQLHNACVWCSFTTLRVSLAAGALWQVALDQNGPAVAAAAAAASRDPCILL
jgi:hypothetical protein